MNIAEARKYKSSTALLNRKKRITGSSSLSAIVIKNERSVG